MTRRRGRDRDVVGELQEDAQWSSYTNSMFRWHLRGGGGRPKPRSSLTRTARIWVLVGVAAVLVAFALTLAIALVTES
jgi:hypothetical protein